MIFIAHRGNISGPNSKLENSPEYVHQALLHNYDVEIDVWYIKSEKKWLTGHDYPQYEIDSEFLLRDGMWCHAKNIEALEKMLEIGAHCFWHQEDNFTLTSRGFLWTYPGNLLTSKSICVMPESTQYSSEELSVCYGICTDYPDKYKKLKFDWSE